MVRAAHVEAVLALGDFLRGGEGAAMRPLSQVIFDLDQGRGF
jgi:hypothetical protein